MARPTPDRTIDTSGSCCPVPLVETNRAVKTMRPGEVLEVISTDPGSKTDIAAWCARTGHKLLHSESDSTTLRYFLRKRG